MHQSIQAAPKLPPLDILNIYRSKSNSGKSRYTIFIQMYLIVMVLPKEEELSSNTKKKTD